MLFRLIFALSVCVFLPFAAQAAEPAPATPASAVAMHGSPKYAPEFTHFDYVNPQAPKGGALRLAVVGTFDTLNPYIIKGVAAPGIGLVYQTLTAHSDDEAFTEYGEIAASIEMPEDRSSVTFNLRPEARFSDGKPLTAADVVWTFGVLTQKGHPFYRAYYANVKEAVAENDHRVKFVFNMAGNRELPLIMGQMPVLPKYAFEGKDFESTTLELPVVGSGPYTVQSVDAGRRMTYARVKDWWAADLAVNKGRYNFDTIIYDMYRDDTVLLTAFFAGEYDFRQENTAKNWATAYDQPTVKDGRVKKEEIAHSIPTGLQAFAFNIRRPMFSDARVRRALGYAFDFEWSNKQVAFGAYKRSDSYFENSELAAQGLPQGVELEVLEKFRGKIPDEVFTTEFQNPATDGSGKDIRKNLALARDMLKEAGWTLGKSGLLEKDGQVFRFEILDDSPMFERWVNPFIANLKKLGIEARFRVVDTAQMQNRLDNFDFDMTMGGFPQSLSPGNEQRDFWAADKADVKGSRNIIGIKNLVVDALIDEIISAPDRDALIARTRALDRVLLWNYYVIPQWHHSAFRVAYWDKFTRPAVTAKYGLGVVETWWYDAQKAGKIGTSEKPDPK